MICEYIKMKTDIQWKGGTEVNGIELNRRATGFPYKGTMVARNSEVCQVEGKLEKDSYDLTVKLQNNSYIIKCWEQNTNIGTLASTISMVGQMIQEKSTDALYETMLPKIFDSFGNQIGEFKYMVEKRQGMQSYHYRKLVLNNRELNCYEVGHDNREILFCMYDSENNMVATVSKRMTIKNGKSRYTMYISNDEFFEEVALATIIMHHENYEGGDKDGVGLSHVSQALNTYQKELLDKYQEDFIPRVIEQEGRENLPENMPLVAELVKKGQRTPGLILGRIGLIAFIIVFLLMMLYGMGIMK